MIYVKAKILSTIVLIHKEALGQTKSPRGLQGAPVHCWKTLRYQIDTRKPHGDM